MASVIALRLSGRLRVTVAIPDVVMTSPTNGNSFIAPASILLKALVSDADNSVAWVDFFNGGALVGSVTNPPYQLTWSGVGNGSYLLSAVVHDAFGPVVTYQTCTLAFPNELTAAAP